MSSSPPFATGTAALGAMAASTSAWVATVGMVGQGGLSLFGAGSALFGVGSGLQRGMTTGKWGSLVSQAATFAIPLAAQRFTMRALKGNSGYRFRGQKTPYCFVAGTRVATRDGTLRIENISVGDEVLSRSEHTGEVGYKRITKLNRGKAVQLCRVTVAPHRRGRTGRHRVGEASAGKEGSDEPPSASQRILSTRDHPYYSVSRRAWIDADALKPGELLRADDGSLLEVVKVEWWAEKAKTYNFEVEDWHSYFVSEAEGKPGIWVHNGPGDVPNPHPGGVPGANIADSGGVRVFHHGSNDADKPAHAHVTSPAGETRIGPNGKPLQGQRELTTRERRLVKENKTEIRREIRRVGRMNKRIENWERVEKQRRAGGSRTCR